MKQHDDSTVARRFSKRPSESIQRLVRHVLLLTLLSVTFAPQLRADAFTDGTKAYEKGEYAPALEHFQSAIANGETAAARHNLALTHFQLGHPAQAAWQMERAVRLAPFKGEYQYKLGALRNELGLFETRPAWYQLAARALSFNNWVLLAAVSFWIALAAVLLPRLGGLRTGLGIKTVRALSIVILALSIPAIVLQARARQSGIVIADTATALHAAPAGAAPESGTARPGERARVIDRHNDFLKIETEGQATGWIAQDAFRPIFSDRQQQ